MITIINKGARAAAAPRTAFDSSSTVAAEAMLIAVLARVPLSQSTCFYYSMRAAEFRSHRQKADVEQDGKVCTNRNKSNC